MTSRKAQMAALIGLIAEIAASALPDVLEAGEMQHLIEQAIVLALIVAGVWAVPNKEIKS